MPSSLPSSGTLSINDIRNFFSTSNGSLFQLSTNFANFFDPYSISNFYGYTLCDPYGTFLGTFCSGCAYYYIYADGSCGTYNQLINSNDPSCGGGCGGGGGYYCSSGPFDPCFLSQDPCWYYGYQDCLSPA